MSYPIPNNNLSSSSLPSTPSSQAAPPPPPPLPPPPGLSSSLSVLIEESFTSSATSLLSSSHPEGIGLPPKKQGRWYRCDSRGTISSSQPTVNDMNTSQSLPDLRPSDSPPSSSSSSPLPLPPPPPSSSQPPPQLLPSLKNAHAITKINHMVFVPFCTTTVPTTTTTTAVQTENNNHQVRIRTTEKQSNTNNNNINNNKTSTNNSHSKVTRSCETQTTASHASLCSKVSTRIQRMQKLFSLCKRSLWNNDKVITRRTQSLSTMTTFSAPTSGPPRQQTHEFYSVRLSGKSSPSLVSNEHHHREFSPSNMSSDKNAYANLSPFTYGPIPTAVSQIHERRRVLLCRRNIYEDAELIFQKVMASAVKVNQEDDMDNSPFGQKAPFSFLPSSLPDPSPLPQPPPPPSPPIVYASVRRNPKQKSSLHDANYSHHLHSPPPPPPPPPPLSLSHNNILPISSTSTTTTTTTTTQPSCVDNSIIQCEQKT